MPSIKGGSGGASSLDGLSDAAITSALGGQILEHDGTNFVNAFPSAYRDVLPTGGLACSLPYQLSGVNVSVLSSGRISMFAINLPKGLLVTSISFISATTALSAGTTQLFGLYDSSMNLLRKTNDDTSTAWGSHTIKTLNLTSTYTTTTRGLHYVAILVAGTVPTLLGCGTGLNTSNNFTPIIAGTSNTGVSDLPATANALTKSNNMAYCYLS